MKPYHIVITTIGKGDIIASVLSNVTVHGHLDEVVLWVVGDRKTPAECQEACVQARSFGLETNYLGIDKQNKLGRRLGRFYERLPWNTDARRNLGYLAALEAGCEWLVLLDDDNYPMSDDLIGCHTQETAFRVLADEPYYNYMTVMGCTYAYPRGYPYTNRNRTTITQVAKVVDKVGANVGLWSGSPDVDAITGLVLPSLVSNISGKTLPRSKWALPAGTWTPINSQNTAIRREFIPAAMFVIQEYPDHKVRLFNRFGDIFAGYFLQAIMSNSEYRVSFGSPVVDHRRNKHSLLRDMHEEHHAILLLEWLLPRLREWKPGAGSVLDQVKEQAAWLFGFGSKWQEGLSQEYQVWLYHTGLTMLAWVDACKEVGA